MAAKFLPPHVQTRLQKEKEDMQREADRKVLCVHRHAGARFQLTLHMSTFVQITEMEDTCRRVREEYVHQCALENARLQDVQTENSQLRDRLSDREEKLRELEDDFTQFKQVARGTPEMELRDQLKTMTLRVRDLDERLRAADTEKKQYKQQLLLALQAIATMKHAREIDTDKKLR
eukprot:SAG25_NODE_813_length_5233_cov_5.402805_3_plen_176_part_00